MSQIEAAVVAAVVAFEAKKRIPTGQRPGVTYFSEHDIWLFVARATGNVCLKCLMYQAWSDTMGGLHGNMLRSEFPYLKILDELTIGGQEPEGRGLVHPNCYCYLMRKIG